MGSVAEAPVSGLVFALLAALVLFGAFFSPPVKRKIQAWWRGIHLHPFEEGSPIEAPARPAAPKPPRVPAPGLHPQPPHIEKKRTPAHRSG